MLAAEIVQQEMEGINLPSNISVEIEIEISFFQEKIEFLDGLLINIETITDSCSQQVLNTYFFVKAQKIVYAF